MDSEQNPYAPPNDVDRAWYDLRLFWRVMKFCGIMLLIFIILDAAILVGYLDRFEQQGSIWTSIQEFFTDWDAAKVPH
jgi:hypothetical protein